MSPNDSNKGEVAKKQTSHFSYRLTNMNVKLLGIQVRFVHLLSCLSGVTKRRATLIINYVIPFLKGGNICAIWWTSCFTLR